MTGKDILHEAMQLMLVPEDSLTDYTSFVLPIINSLLPRLYSVNYLACTAAGVPEEEIPHLQLLTDLQQEIPLRPEIAALLPIGVCIHLAAEDDDLRRSWFAEQYRDRLAAVSATCTVPVKDVY